MRKAVGIGDGIGEDNAMGSFVEGFGDIPKPFLSCSIPYIERYLTSFELNSFDFKIYANSAEVIWLKSILAIPH